MKKRPFQIKDLVIVCAIIAVALGFRLYKINTPLADLHSWRQVDTASVARNFVRDGLDLLHPRYDDLSDTQSGKDNPNGYRFVEFPIYNAMFAVTYRMFPAFPLEVHGRLVSIFFSLIIVAVLYYFGLSESGRVTAIVSSMTYAIYPFFVFFSRMVLPETTALSFAFLSLFFLYVSHGKSGSIKWILFFLSIVSFSLSLLIKPTTIFYSIALLYIFFQKYRFSFFKKIEPYIYFALSIAPFVLWRMYISQFPEGIPASQWLITSVNTFEGQKIIFFRPAFFRWIFFERINNLILGGFLAVPLIIGVVKKQSGFFYSVLLSALAYLFVFQGGNVQHEYYQILILPSIALLIGSGVSFFERNRRMFIHPVFLYATLLFLFGCSFFFSYYKVKDFYQYPPELPQIAKIVNTLTKKDDKIITDRMGDTTLLYLIDRKGSPILGKSLDEYKEKGYSYFVTLTNDTIRQTKDLGKFDVVFENDKFALFHL